MTRVNVYRTEDDGTGQTTRLLDGWFDLDRAELFKELTQWDGNNNVSVHVAKFHHQGLYRTAKGRWVLHSWSQWQGSDPTYEFVSDEAAKVWLIKNEDDEVVEKYFGALEDERGPGRPAVGRPVNVRFSEEALEDLDALAAARMQSRADVVRDAVVAYLGMLDGTSATYTVEVQEHVTEGSTKVWRALTPPEAMRYPAFPGAGGQLAQLVALNRAVPDGIDWRVVVGGDKKTPGGDPSIAYPPSTSEVDDDEQG